MKTCADCGRTMPARHFRIDYRRKGDQRSPYCSACHYARFPTTWGPKAPPPMPPEAGDRVLLYVKHPARHRRLHDAPVIPGVSMNKLRGTVLPVIANEYKLLPDSGDIDQDSVQVRVEYRHDDDLDTVTTFTVPLRCVKRKVPAQWKVRKARTAAQAEENRTA